MVFQDFNSFKHQANTITLHLKFNIKIENCHIYLSFCSTVNQGGNVKIPHTEAWTEPLYRTFPDINVQIGTLSPYSLGPDPTA